MEEGERQREGEREREKEGGKERDFPFPWADGIMEEYKDNTDISPNLFIYVLMVGERGKFYLFIYLGMLICVGVYVYEWVYVS